jgi:UDP:flavonoid glycosyltransferase YjiC (YdhE family)
VILFPAIKQFGKPWVRIISCSENEIEDPDIPPHLSGCGENDKACHAVFRARFEGVIKPIHDDFNAFLKENREAPYPLGQFFEASPFMNLLLYPEAAKFKRRHPLPPSRFQYLEGCVRQEKPYEVPAFAANAGKPLLYISFGSLGAGDVDLLKRLIAAIGKLPYRALVNVGDYKDQYDDVPPNVIVESWFPQPMRSSITAATTPSPNAFISASPPSSCPMSGTGMTTPPVFRKQATASNCTATIGPMRNWRKNSPPALATRR